MATADATGRTTREKLVDANTFLKVLTVGEIKRWADRKMAAVNSQGRLLRPECAGLCVPCPNSQELYGAPFKISELRAHDPGLPLVS